MSAACTDPKQSYAARLERHRARLGVLGSKDDRIADLRLGTFVLALVVAGAAIWAGGSPLWILLALFGFAVLVLWHGRVLREKAQAAEDVAFYERGLARIDDAWEGSGIQRTDFLPPDHPYAEDLDLFGPGSLFELLATTRTGVGQQTLASWLLNPAALEMVQKRQAAIYSLRPRLDLREALNRAGQAVAEGGEPQRLYRWAEQDSPLSSTAMSAAPWLAWLLPLVLGAAVVGWNLDAWGPLPMAVIVLLEWAGLRAFRPSMATIVSTLEQPAQELERLASVLALWEREPSKCEHLEALKARLSRGERLASEHIRALHRRITWLDAQRNQFFAPLGFLLMWNLHFGLAVERWRLRHGALLRPWLEALGELEALAALSAYAYEHPEDPFPELDSKGPSLVAEGLGHPLLPRDRCVRNDLELCGEGRAYVVSGSNMSGKSTLLRTVGINVVLALCGAPVRAHRMRLAALQVGRPCVFKIRYGGGSRVFCGDQALETTLGSQSKRASAALLAGRDSARDQFPRPSPRRRGGAALLFGGGRPGFGDHPRSGFEHLADRMGERVRNIHFEDSFQEGSLHFDYRIKEGTVTTAML